MKFLDLNLIKYPKLIEDKEYFGYYKVIWDNSYFLWETKKFELYGQDNIFDNKMGLWFIKGILAEETLEVIAEREII